MSLRAAVGGHADAAEDLLHVVSQAPRLKDLATFQTVRISVNAGKLILSIEEVHMHARPLSSEGVPRTIPNRDSLPKYSMSEALLVHDLQVRGQSILRRAS